MCFVQGAFEEDPVERFRPLSMRMGVVMIGFPRRGSFAKA
jgi:hypothetical protein